MIFDHTLITANHVILAIIVAGLAIMLIGWHMDATSDFEGGSFLLEIFLIMVGMFMIAGAVIWKFIMSLVQ